MESILLSKCESSKKNLYLIRKYLKFIADCDSKNSKVLVKNIEKHHICPKSKTLFPEYESFKLHPWNMVKLSSRQHLIAHKMLAKIYGGRMWIALNRMRTRKDENGNRFMMNSREYEAFRIEFVKVMKALAIGRTFSKETRLKISIAGRGRVNSENHRKAISQAQKGKPKPQKQLTCTYCGKIGRTAPMMQHHFDNCKLKPGNTSLLWYNNGVEEIQTSSTPYNGFYLGRLPKPKVKCPYCEKVGSGAGMKMFHFEKCKNR